MRFINNLKDKYLWKNYLLPLTILVLVGIVSISIYDYANDREIDLSTIATLVAGYLLLSILALLTHKTNKDYEGRKK